jgi:DNA-binding cell septation regulator SpoVG
MTAPIEVLAIRPLDGKSTVKAFVDLQLGGIKIMGAKIVQQNGQRAWVAMPSVKTERAWNVVEITSKDLRQRVTDVVLRAWAMRQDEPPAREAGRSARQRDEHINELARRFDERAPDEVPF